MAKAVKKIAKAIRSRRVRMSASIDSVTKIVERQFGLPPGSVSLVLPSGRRKNGNSTVQSLWDSWN